MERRKFIKTAIAISGGLSFPSLLSCRQNKMHFKISLAQWSLHRSLNKGRIDNLDFVSVAKNEFDINAVEYVNSFFFDKAENKKYLREMKNSGYYTFSFSVLY